MTKKRKRLNISIDLETYEELKRMCRLYRIESCPTLIVAFTHLLTDRMAEAEQRRYELAETDAEYIDKMFEEFGCSMRQPDGIVPKRGHKTDID